VLLLNTPGTNTFSFGGPCLLPASIRPICALRDAPRPQRSSAVTRAVSLAHQMRGRRSLLVAAACTIRCVCGILIGASVVPHGDFSVLPSLLPAGSVNRTRAQSLHDAAFAATSIVTAAAPDVILLVAPHAIALSIDFGVYTGSNASGTALIRR